MSTPLVDIPLPYGYTVGGEPGKGYQSPVDGSSYNIPLKPGPCRVMASWSGPERADFILYRNGQSTVLDTIPEKAGGSLNDHPVSRDEDLVVRARGVGCEHSRRVDECSHCGKVEPDYLHSAGDVDLLVLKHLGAPHHDQAASCVRHLERRDSAGTGGAPWEKRGFQSEQPERLLLEHHSAVVGLSEGPVRLGGHHDATSRGVAQAVVA